MFLPMYFRNLYFKEKNKLYLLANNMEYSKIMPNLNLDELEYDIENKVYTDGFYVIKENGKIIGLYDYVNQTLFTDDKDLLERL